MQRAHLIGVLAMATVVVASNILVQFLLGSWLTWGALTYPFAFLVTDLMNRLYGSAAARKVVVTGFGVGVACSLIGTQIMLDFGPAVTLRIAIGSGIAFLAAQLTDITVFNRLRAGSWWRAPLVSSLVGASLDTALFFAIAFSATLAFIAPGVDVAWANEPVPLLGLGPVAPLWVSLAVADFCVKMVLVGVALGPYAQIVKRVQGAKALS